MRIAVIGSGIAGLGAAWLLSREHEVTLFEKNDYLGGHTHTHNIDIGDQQWQVDSGFIVMNYERYPLFSGLLTELNVPTQPSSMSFSVSNPASGLEYNAGNLNGLFCQRSNVVSPRFWRMLADIRRFYRVAPELLSVEGAGPSLGDYLQAQNYSQIFRDEHIVPMASALWSTPSAQILNFPAKYLVRFMHNHQMLQLSNRPQWQVVQGGSQSYVRAMSANWQVNVRLSSPVQQVRRSEGQVYIKTATGELAFDQVVLACHSDQALDLLLDPSEREREVLGAILYQKNEAVLHSDASVLPKRRAAWAAWNVHIPAQQNTHCSVSYYMNALQSLHAPLPFIVSLNRGEDIASEKVLKRMTYHHPVYSHQMVAAQGRRAEINGVNRTWYCGAYWGFGFHEDGFRSAVEVAAQMGIRWPQG